MSVLPQILRNDVQRAVPEYLIDIFEDACAAARIKIDVVSVLRIKVEMTAEATEKPSDIKKLARHPKLDISNRPSLTRAHSQFVSKIDSYRAPQTGKVVQKKMRDVMPMDGCAAPEATVLEEVAFQDVLGNSLMRQRATDGLR